MTSHPLYCSVDVETDGDCPGMSSMLSIGVVALSPANNLSFGRTFYATLKRLPDARPLNTTMEWWDQYPESWAAARENPADPADVMRALDEWLSSVVTLESSRMLLPPGDTLQPKFVAYPANFDWMWVTYYFHRFLGRNPFGYAAIDMASLAAGLLRDIQCTRRTRWPDEWSEGIPDNDHHALHDAENQANVFRNMMRTASEGK